MSGWKVVEVVAGPGGPPRTRWGGNDRDPWARVPSLAPRVVALRPDGRRTTVGSWARWEALRAACRPPESRGPRADQTVLDDIAALLDRQVWSPDTIASIADLVRSSGREVGDPDDAEADGAA